MFEVAEYIGTIAFVISGFLVAVRAKLDFLGVLISVFLTAFGGGVIRDLIVDKTPYSFSHDIPGIIVFSMMTLLILFKVHKKLQMEEQPIFIISDSIGLVSFSITGALIAIEANLNLTGILALSFITAVGGGITRDIIINEVPLVVKTGFYGTVSLFVGLLMYLAHILDILDFYTISFIFIISLSLRVIAYYKKWSIPLL